MPFKPRPHSSGNRPPPRGRGAPPFGKPAFGKPRRDSAAPRSFEGGPREDRRPSGPRRDSPGPRSFEGGQRDDRRPLGPRRDYSRPFEGRPRQDGPPAGPRRDSAAPRSFERNDRRPAGPRRGYPQRQPFEGNARQDGPPAAPRRDWERPRSFDSRPPRPDARPRQGTRPHQGAGPRRFDAPSREERRSAERRAPPAPYFKPSFRERQAERPTSPRPPERPGVEPPPVEERSDLIEGRNPVYEALKAGRPINKLLVAHGVGDDATITEILNLAREADILVDRVDRQVINNLSITKHSQGVLAIAAAKAYVKLEEILQIARDKGEVPLVIILDGIEDPHNLGAVIRTAEAAGAHGIVIPERRAVGLTATVARTSAGAMEYVPVARVSNLSNALAALKKEGLWTVGITAEGAQAYTAVDFSQPTALVIGAEGAGLSRLVKERCDLLASIPMVGRVNSLNASVAAALVMYEVLRQRRP